MANALQLATMHLPAGSIEAYIQQVNKIPMLTAEEEREFAQEFQQNNDLEAARSLVLAHLRYVVRVARGYMGYGLPLGDLIQEGNIGLMKAVKRFDPSVGVRLVSFAVHWIKAEIHEFVLKNWRIVKVATTKAQRKLFFNLRNMKKRLGWTNLEEREQIASDLGVSTAEVDRMEMRLNAMDSPYDSPYSEDSELSYLAPANQLAAQNTDPALLVEAERHADDNQMQLVSALESLDERSRDIVQQRWLAEKKATLHELAAHYGVSAERIRQLENNAMKKLKAAMLQAA